VCAARRGCVLSVLNVVDGSCARIKGTEWKPIKLDSDVTF
jgi:hypothetical protein